jgi:hypothetical protein
MTEPVTATAPTRLPTATEAVIDGAPRHAPQLRRRNLLVVIAAAVLAAPCIFAGAAVAGAPWSPAGDWAMLELRTLDVVSADAPLLGPYSRFGWNHPGPLLFLALAVPYQLAGQASGVLLATAAAINAVAVVAAVTLAWRRGGALLVGIAGIALVAVQSSLGSDMLRDPWNPWITVLPFALLLVAAWASLEGDRWAPVVVAITGSFLAQSHIGFTPVVAVLTVMATAGWLLRRQPLLPLLLGAAVLVACWVPSAVDTIAGERNAVHVIRHFGVGGGEAVGLGASLGLAADQLALDGPWSFGDEHISPHHGGVEPGALSGLFPPVLAMLAAATVAWRSGDQRALRLQLTVVVAAVVGIVSVSRIDGEPYDYLLRWWWPLAALWWVAVVWPLATAAYCALRRRAGRVARIVPRALGAGLGVLGAPLLLLPTIDGEQTTPNPEWTPVITETATAVLEKLEPRTGSVTLRSTGPLAGWVEDGLALELTKAGIDVKVPDEGLNVEKYGRHRLVDHEGGGDVVELLVLTSPAGAQLIGGGSVRIAHRPAATSTPQVDVYANHVPDRLEPGDGSYHLLEGGR